MQKSLDNKEDINTASICIHVHVDSLHEPVLHTHAHIEKNKSLQLTGSSQGLILNILSLHVVTCHGYNTLNDSITSAYMDVCVQRFVYTCTCTCILSVPLTPIKESLAFITS